MEGSSLDLLQIFGFPKKKENKNNNNFKEDIRLVESFRFSCRSIQQKAMKKETTPIPIILINN